MKSKDEIERTKSVLKKMRATFPPITFLAVMAALMGAFGVPFWPSVLIGILLAGAEYVAFSLMLNRWAGL